MAGHDKSKENYMTSVLLLGLLTVGQTIVDSPLPILIDVPVTTVTLRNGEAPIVLTRANLPGPATADGGLARGYMDRRSNVGEWTTVRGAGGKMWLGYRTGPNEVALWCATHQQWNRFTTDRIGALVDRVLPSVRYYTAPTYTYTAPTYQGRYGATWTNVAPAQTYNNGNYGRTYNYGNNGNYYPANRTYGARAAGTCRNCRR